MFGWGKQKARQLDAHEVARWLAHHAAEQGTSRVCKEVCFRAAVLLETEREEQRAFVDDVLGQ